MNEKDGCVGASSLLNSSGCISKRLASVGDIVFVDRLRNKQTHILGLLGAVEAGVSVSAEPWQGFCLGTSDAGKEL